MNIFYLDSNPRLCAQAHFDSHVRKMILESAQLLCTAHFVAGSHVDGMYKPTHINHPCAIWVRSAPGNYDYCWHLGWQLCEEFRHRWGKEHATQKVFGILAHNPKGILEAASWQTPVPLAMPDEYKVPNDPIASYRKYYRLGKKHLNCYTNREAPEWLVEVVE